MAPSTWELTSAGSLSLAPTRWSIANVHDSRSLLTLTRVLGTHAHDPRYSTASDVWAFGVTVWEIMADGALPYEDHVKRNGNLALVANYVKAGGTLQKPAGCPEAV